MEVPSSTVREPTMVISHFVSVDSLLLDQAIYSFPHHFLVDKWPLIGKKLTHISTNYEDLLTSNNSSHGAHYVENTRLEALHILSVIPTMTRPRSWNSSFMGDKAKA